MWDRFPDATQYVLSGDPINNPTANSATATYGANTVMGSINNLTPNTLYKYTLMAKNSTGDVLAQESGEQLTAPQEAALITSVVPRNSTTLEITFSVQSNVHMYVLRALDTKDHPTFLEEVHVTSSPAYINSLQPYTEYKLAIMTANNGGRSQPSPAIVAQTLLPSPQVNSSSPNKTTIDVSWTSVTGAVLYTVTIIQMIPLPMPPIISYSQNTTNLNMTFTELTPGVTYEIIVYGWDKEGHSGEPAYSKQVTRPSAPTSVTVKMVNDSNALGLLVSWEEGPGEPGALYTVNSSFPWLDCWTTHPNTSCELSPVLCGTAYTVEVTAYNSGGPSVPSSPVTFTTVPCPPSSLTVAETTPENCTFSWGSVSYADRYKAIVTTVQGVDTVCNTTGTSCNFACECGYTYLMSVFAVNEAGHSPPGPMINYTTVPCCPTSVNVSLIGSDTLEVEWERARGAEIYETKAVDSSHLILCNDSAPVCVLSYLNCDTPYSVKVISCNDISGCNHNCPHHTQDTAPCTPTGITMTKVNTTAVHVSWTDTNRDASYTVFVNDRKYLCTDDTKHNCVLTNLPCGSTFDVFVTANNNNGKSLPSYSETYETEPCCPDSLNVTQMTQAMTKVSWSPAHGAHTFLTALTSSKGHARCHTEDTHCIMGCITCSTNYSVSMEVYSLSGLQTNCSYTGFSSSLCCPAGVRIYHLQTNSVRVSWRTPSGPLHSTQVNITGMAKDYSCTARPGVNYCDVSGVNCGDEYTVVVAPITRNGIEDFCPHRKYEVSCGSGGSLGAIIFRGKRSLE